MKKIIILILITIMLAGCKKSSTNNKDFKIYQKDGDAKYISYNELYRNIEEYSIAKRLEIEFQATIIYYDEKSEHAYDIDVDMVEELGDEFYDNPEQAYIYYTIYKYKIYGYIGDNKDNIVDISYHRIVYDDNRKEPDPVWKVKKGDVVNCFGYLGATMSEYTNDGQTSKVPAFVVETEKCTFED